VEETGHPYKEATPDMYFLTLYHSTVGLPGSRAALLLEENQFPQTPFYSVVLPSQGHFLSSASGCERERK
jgi:hypothetical protein